MLYSRNKIDEIVNRIVGSYDPDKIILFGSYAKGTPNEHSDVDLFVVKDSEKTRPERGIELCKLLYGSMIPMDILVYTNKEIQESINNKYSFVYEVFANGLTLYERKK